MQPEHLPHLRLRRIVSGPFRNPRGFGPERRLPERNPAAHAQALLANITAVEAQLRVLAAAVERPPQAQGHLVAADALPDTDLATDSLGDKRAEIVVVAESADGALLHLRRDDLSPLKRKVTDYGNEAKRTRTGRPRNQALVAPLEGLRTATLTDLSGGAFSEATVVAEQRYWVELWTRGGRLEDEETRDRVWEEIAWLAQQSGIAPEHVRRFRATERDVYLLRLSGSTLLDLPSRLPEVYRVVPATAALRDFIVSELEAEFVEPEGVGPPSADAPAVVLLDTGISPEHPLLRSALVAGGRSVVVGDPSPVDTDGHGTEMAGLAAYDELGDQLERGAVEPRAWLQSVRLIPNDQQGDDDREFWPERTQQAVEVAEEEGPDRRVFNMCISAENLDPPTSTSWSVGVDLLTHNEGRGRLFFVAAGNVSPPSANRDDYPNLNLVSFIDDPAQALNALTVGALTDRTAIPNDQAHGNLVALAGEGELSPYARCGVTGSFPIKPEIVYEGGNCAPDGVLPYTGIETLSVLTTDRRHAQGRPLTFTWATSAACASASGLAAEVWTQNPNFRAETIRALVVHSARWTDGICAQFPDRRERLNASGYGVPRADLASFSARSRPTLVIEDQLRPTTLDDEGHRNREHHLIALPLPDEELLALGEHEVELSVTLSYFVEPNESSRTNYAGANLRWDIQREGETDDAFRQRVNRLVRADGFEPEGRPYPWEIGTDARSRGSVQSDRCRVTAASLAGGKMIAVYPTLGWWEGRPQRDDALIPYGLVVTIDAGDAAVDLYALIEALVAVAVPAA